MRTTPNQEVRKLMIAHRVLLAAGLLAGVLLGSLPADAADWKPFTAEAFSAAQKDGKSILVDISAPWCPTCRAQKPILEKLTAMPAFKDLVVLQVDFDTQKGDVRALKAQSQSTLIAFKGENEIARSVGETSPGAIETLMKSAL
jgi:thioredoxin